MPNNEIETDDELRARNRRDNNVWLISLQIVQK